MACKKVEGRVRGPWRQQHRRCQQNQHADVSFGPTYFGCSEFVKIVLPAQLVNLKFTLLTSMELHSTSASMRTREIHAKVMQTVTTFVMRK